MYQYGEGGERVWADQIPLLWTIVCSSRFVGAFLAKSGEGLAGILRLLAFTQAIVDLSEQKVGTGIFWA
jgi:hypothetical protein